jgi:hypothetical protein
LVAFYLSKIHLKNLEIEAAHNYIKKSIALNKNHINSFILLALIFTSKNEYKKANKILEELIFEQKENSFLYLMK